MSRLLALTLVLFSLGVAPAHAQNEATRDEAAHGNAATGDAAERASELFRESADAYQRGDFPEAAALLRDAYRLDPVPVLQYNLARALEGMGDLSGAIDAYALYLEFEPDPRDRGAIEARLDTLERQIAEREALLEEAERRGVAEVVPAPIEPPRRPARVAPWLVAGLGALTLVSAAGTGVAGSARHGEAVDPVTNHREAARLADRADGLALATNILLVAGGVLLLAGGVWGVVDLTGRGDAEGTALVVGPGSLGLRAHF